MHEERQKVQVWVYAKDPGGDWWVLILLTRPERGSFWQPVTGSVDAGEPIAEAALREAREETGLSFVASPEPLGQPFFFEKNGLQFRETGFGLKARADSAVRPPVRIDPHEHVEARWVSLDQARQLIRFPSNVTLLEALAERLNRKERP